eukprot:2957312-Prymnesium_polylepis.1
MQRFAKAQAAFEDSATPLPSADSTPRASNASPRASKCAAASRAATAALRRQCARLQVRKPSKWA